MRLLLQRLRTVVWRDDAPRRHWSIRGLRGAVQIGWAVVRDLASGQLTLRAMSLVYTTLLSLVPLLAFSFSVLKGFGVHRAIEPALARVMEPLGQQGVEITARIMGFVENVKGSVLGGIGLFFLIVTVISMIQKVEDSFNYVWEVQRARSLARRFSDYLSVLLVGPVLMVTAMTLLASVSSTGIVQRLKAVQPLGEVLVFAGELLPFGIVVMVFTFVYTFVPNTRVRLRPALIGGLAAGLLWVTVGGLFASFVVKSTRYTAIYSGFAIALVALIWLYISWLILIIGAAVAFYAQHPRARRWGRRTERLSNTERERLALAVMYEVGHAFHTNGARRDIDALAQRLGQPGATLEHVTSGLEAAGLLLRAEDGRLLPGRDTSSITVCEILEIVRNGARPGVLDLEPAVEALVEETSQAVRARLGGRTLADLVAEAPAAAAPGDADDTGDDATPHAGDRADDATPHAGDSADDRAGNDGGDGADGATPHAGDGADDRTGNDGGDGADGADHGRDDRADERRQPEQPTLRQSPAPNEQRR